MTTPYDGKILLVNWVPSTTPGETITDLAKLLRAKMPNVMGVMLKTSNGISWQGHIGEGDSGPQAITGVQRIQQWVDAFAPYGLEVHVWGVPRGKDALDIPKEAEKFVRAATVPGVKSLLLDVEHGELYWLGTPSHVQELMGQIRAQTPPDLHIGMILDGRRNRDFSFWVDPWMPFVDSLHPMFYPILFNPDIPISVHLEVPFRNLGPYNKPIVPMLQAFGEHSRRPTPDEIIQQATLAWNSGAVGISYFRLGCDRWGKDGLPHMGEPEYAAIAQVPARVVPSGTVDVPPPAPYTWQSVFNAAALVALRANASYEQWLSAAGVWAVFVNNLRSLPYSGPPIKHWPLDEAYRQEILKLLATCTAEELVQLIISEQEKKQVEEAPVRPQRKHGAIVGIHGAPGTSPPPPHTWDMWVDHLKKMGVQWYKQCDNGGLDFGPHSIFAWCKRLKAEGIEPIIRYMAWPQFPDALADHYFEKMRRYAAEGILWAEIGNEPNLDCEWKDPWRNREGHAPMNFNNPEVIRIIAETWVRDARKALEAGVKPAFYAMAPTDWQNNSNHLYSSVYFTQNVVAYLAQHQRAATLDIFRRGGWIAVHAATYEKAVDFDPYRPEGVVWDMTLRSYEVVLRAFKKFFGADLNVDGLAVMSTEGGVFTPESTSMGGHERLASNEEHAHRVVEMFQWLEKNSPLHAMCPWCVSVGSQIGHYHEPFRHDGYFEEINGGLRPRAVIEAMRQLRFDNERLNEQAAMAGARAASTLVRLDVPYVSQFDETGQPRPVDGGMACMAMLLNAGKSFNKRTPLETLYQHIADDGVTSLEDMAKIGQGEGFTVRRFQYLDGDEALHELRGLLQQNIPVVVQVNYAKWDEITGNNYTGVQFVLAVGCDDAHIFVHDPLFRGARRNRGAHFVWRNQRFLEGWGSLHELDGQDFVALTLDKQVARR